MEPLSYQQFIDEINSGKILKAVFKVKDYAHYKNCSIERITNVLKNGNAVVTIYVKLTKDSEQVGFFKIFDEKYKLFNRKQDSYSNIFIPVHCLDHTHC